MNGSFIDGQAISAPVALDFAKERRLKLGQFGFELAVQHLAAIAPEGPLVAGAAENGDILATELVLDSARALAASKMILSLGEWALSSGRPRPSSSVSAPRTFLKSFTIGMEPPSRNKTGSRLNA